MRLPFDCRNIWAFAELAASFLEEENPAKLTRDGVVKLNRSKLSDGMFRQLAVVRMDLCVFVCL